MSRGIDEHAELFADTMDVHSANHCIAWLESKIQEDRDIIDSMCENDMKEYSELFTSDIERRQGLIERLQANIEGRKS